jgi:hypothetical protein
MKKLLLIIAVGLVSCSKNDFKEKFFVRSKVDFRATYVNDLFIKEYKNVTIEVNGLQTYTFNTDNNPCMNRAYGFSMYSNDSIAYVPYIIRTDRDTLEVGLLQFKVQEVNKQLQ